MRFKEIICEGFRPPQVLYHGTKPKFLSKIEQEGLTRVSDQSWNEFGQGVYLALTQEMAAQYGPVIFAIKVSDLDEGELVPDDHELRDYFNDEWGDGSEGDYDEDEFRPDGIFTADWLDSLRICGQCQYLADIPFSALRIIRK